MLAEKDALIQQQQYLIEKMTLECETNLAAKSGNINTMDAEIQTDFLQVFLLRLDKLRFHNVGIHRICYQNRFINWSHGITEFFSEI